MIRSPKKRVVAFLRSRRIAIGLIIAAGALSAVGTIPGQEDWYTHPLFIAPLAWLTLATAVCAWERTLQALRFAKDPARVPESVLERARSRPQAAVRFAGGTEADVAEALRSQGLRVVQDSGVTLGSAGRIGLLGSPLFHWSLVALFVVIALGQLTVSSGLLGAPLGETVVEEEAAYGILDTGPLFSAHTGYGITVDRWQREYVVDGIDRGPVPTVVVTDGDRVLARQDVYANRPLRVGSTLIHMSDWGLSPQVVLLDDDGSELVRQRLLVDFVEDDPAKTVPAILEYADEAGQLWDIAIALSPPDQADKRSTDETVPADALIQVSPTDGAPGQVQRLPQGETLALPGGGAITLAQTTYYARLSVVRDWSVWPIYALLVAATIGLTLSLLVPYRTAWVVLVGAGQNQVAHVVTRHIRREVLFVHSIEDALVASALRKEQAS